MQAGGQRYNAETGRRCGTVSLASLVDALPGPSISVSGAINVFAAKRLDATDMVSLLGCHTIEVTHCSEFEDRITNFQNTGAPDPTMPPSLLASLRTQCLTNTSIDNTVNLDQNPAKSSIVSNPILLSANNGEPRSPSNRSRIALDLSTMNMVGEIATGSDFLTEFSQALIKMGATQVLTGSQGQIRTNCRAVNSIGINSKKNNGGENRNNGFPFGGNGNNFNRFGRFGNNGGKPGFNHHF